MLLEGAPGSIVRVVLILPPPGSKYIVDILRSCVSCCLDMFLTKSYIRRWTDCRGQKRMAALDRTDSVQCSRHLGHQPLRGLQYITPAATLHDAILRRSAKLMGWAIGPVDTVLTAHAQPFVVIPTEQLEQTRKTCRVRQTPWDPGRSVDRARNVRERTEFFI